MCFVKKEITQEEYDILSSELKKLEERHESLRQSHIDANSEGDQRECDAWYLTDRLSKQNVELIKEIVNFLDKAVVVQREKKEWVDCGSKVVLDINGMEKEYVFCHSILLRYINNGISDSSIIGRDIFKKKVGYTSGVTLENGSTVQISVRGLA
jgi:transcription elongation GreA/GreB family factor